MSNELQKVITHPAKYSDILLPIFAEKLQGYTKILDPMAGTGKIGLIKTMGWTGSIVCNEIQSEYALLYTYSQYVNWWHFTDAANMDWAKDGEFDAICTSPTYGNRYADHWIPKDISKRYSYTFGLGHELYPENTGKMQWGDAYQRKHCAIWVECVRVLRNGGRFILNISNFIRNGQEINVKDWHKAALLGLGLQFIEEIPVKTKRMRNGANNQIRVPYEYIVIFEKV